LDESVELILFFHEETVKQEKPAPRLPKQLRNQPFSYPPPHQLQINLPANAIMKTFRAFFSAVRPAPDLVNLTRPDSFFLPTHGAPKATLGLVPPLLFSW
jgi:hypothetical protein